MGSQKLFRNTKAVSLAGEISMERMGGGVGVCLHERKHITQHTMAKIDFIGYVLG